MLEPHEVNLTVNFQTLGCRLNQTETEGAARFFKESGFKVDFSPVTAQSLPIENLFLTVINTCAVTTKAEQKARRLIRLVLSKNENAAVLVTGCYAELSKQALKKIDSRVCVLEGKKKALISKLPEALSIRLANGPSELASFIQDFFDNNEVSLSPFALATPTFLYHSRPAIKIQDGCNFNCTYCTICIARGKSVSLDVEEVLKQVSAIENEGYGEVVFTAVNIANYKGLLRSSGEIFDFTDLLSYLLEHTKKINFRISSIYPQIVDERFACVIKNERVCPYFHISVQSGSDDILKAMARPYKAEQILKASDLLKKAKDNPFLACDIITGFPGETDEDFGKTLYLCKKIGFQQIHAFPFSPRAGTRAFSMKPKIPNETAGNRVSVLEELSKKNLSDYIKSFEGKELDAILETKNHAVTKNFLHCVLPSSGVEVSTRVGEPVEPPRSFESAFEEPIASTGSATGSLVKVKILGEIENAKNEWRVEASIAKLGNENQPN